MTSQTIDSPTVGEALQGAAARAAGLLRAVPEPDAAVPGLAWTVSQTAAHLVAEFQDYAAFARGTLDPGAPLAPGDQENAAQRSGAANSGSGVR